MSTRRRAPPQAPANSDADKADIDKMEARAQPSKDAANEIDPNAPVTYGDMEKVVSGIGQLLENSMKTTVTEFKQITDNSIKDALGNVNGRIDEVAGRLEQVVEHVNKLTVRVNNNGGGGGGEGPAIEGRPAPVAANGLQKILGGIDLAQIQDLLNTAVTARNALTGQPAANPDDQIFNLVATAAKREVINVAKNNIKRALKKNLLFSEEVEQVLGDGVENAVTGGGNPGHTGLV